MGAIKVFGGENGLKSGEILFLSACDLCTRAVLVLQ